MGDVADYFTVAEAAAELGLSKSRLEQFIRAGTITVAGQIGGVRLLLKKDVKALKPSVHGKAGRPPNVKPPEPPAKKRGRRP